MAKDVKMKSETVPFRVVFTNGKYNVMLCRNKTHASERASAEFPDFVVANIEKV